ncbi:hypothetical protein ACLOJK_025312 [Asimina triloba]
MLASFPPRKKAAEISDWEHKKTSVQNKDEALGEGKLQIPMDALLGTSARGEADFCVDLEPPTWRRWRAGSGAPFAAQSSSSCRIPILERCSCISMLTADMVNKGCEIVGRALEDGGEETDH